MRNRPIETCNKIGLRTNGGVELGRKISGLPNLRTTFGLQDKNHPDKINVKILTALRSIVTYNFDLPCCELTFLTTLYNRSKRLLNFTNINCT